MFIIIIHAYNSSNNNRIKFNLLLMIVRAGRVSILKRIIRNQLRSIRKVGIYCRIHKMLNEEMFPAMQLTHLINSRQVP